MRSRTTTRRTASATLGLLAVAALLAALLILVTPAKASALTAPEQDYLSRINGLRTSLGLNALAIDPTMTQLARQHTQEMLNGHSLHHTTNLRAGVGGSWTKLGENVGYGSWLDLVWDAFVKSPTHYQNLVDPAFTHVGISVMEGPDGLQWTTHRFMAVGRPSAPANAAASSGPAPATSPATTAPAPAPAPARPAKAPTPPPPPPPPAPAPADPTRVATVLNALRGA